MTREEIRKKANYNRRQKSQGNRELNVRQAQVLTYLALGKRVREIAQELGVSDDSIRRDIRRLEETKTYDNRLKVELEKHCLLWNKAFACIEANLDSGNLKAAEDILKYTGIWIDRLDVVAKVEPGDQQKKMMANMEALLKLSGDKVKGALPEKTGVAKKPTEIYADELPGPVKLPEFLQKEIDETVGIRSEKPKETETQSQLEMTKNQRACTCPADRDNPVNIDSACPVHGDKNHPAPKTVNRYQPRYPCTCPDWGVDDPINKDPKCPIHGKKAETCTCDFGHSTTGDPVTVDPKCPVHGDKNRGGGHPPPGGSSV